MEDIRVVDFSKEIEAVSGKKIIRNIVASREPVLIKNLFYDRQISKLRSLSKFRHKAGSVELDLIESIQDLFELGETTILKKSRSKKTTFAEYTKNMGGVLKNFICIENRTPDIVRELFGDLSMLELPFYDKDILSFMYIGPKGTFGPLHFDGDCRNVFLYQVYGFKKVLIIRPEEGWKCFPLGNFSTVNLNKLRRKEYLEFLDYTNARECTLRPGDTIFIPPLHWHALTYVNNCMSIGFRAGRNSYCSGLSDVELFTSYYWLLVANYFLRKKERDSNATQLCDSILKKSRYRKGNVSKCYEANFKRYRTLVEELYPKKNHHSFNYVIDDFALRYMKSKFK